MRLIPSVPPPSSSGAGAATAAGSGTTTAHASAHASTRESRLRCRAYIQPANHGRPSRRRSSSSDKPWLGANRSAIHAGVTMLGHPRWPKATEKLESWRPCTSFHIRSRKLPTQHHRCKSNQLVMGTITKNSRRRHCLAHVPPNETDRQTQARFTEAMATIRHVTRFEFWFAMFAGIPRTGRSRSAAPLQRLPARGHSRRSGSRRSRGALRERPSSAARPAWNDSIHDLTTLRLSPAELVRACAGVACACVRCARGC
jgi:hypothetical protein